MIEECGGMSCTCDSLSIYDSNTADPSKLLGKVCGQQHPGTFTSTGNNMYIVFASDGSGQYVGFKAKYSADSGEQFQCLSMKL